MSPCTGTRIRRSGTSRRSGWRPRLSRRDSVEQVQQIVRTANTYKIPLFPISTGKNLGYGGSASEPDGKRHRRPQAHESHPGGRRQAALSALVEPGVAYFDLYRYIQERKLKLWLDVPDPGWGSVIGNALDHGVGYTTTQFRNHFGAHCGVEVVLPNGDVMRTGMERVPRIKELAGLSVRLRTLRRRTVRPGQLRHRHEDGYLADARAGSLSPRYRARAEARDIVPLVNHVNYLENLGLIGQPGFRSPLGFAQAREPELRALVAKPGGPNG